MEIKRHIDSRKLRTEPATLSKNEKKIMKGEDSTHSTAKRENTTGEISKS